MVKNKLLILEMQDGMMCKNDKSTVTMMIDKAIENKPKDMEVISNMIELRVLERQHMSTIIEERNKVPESLRTSQLLNWEKQLDYYETELCNRDSKTRYWAGYIDDKFAFYGGIEAISFENSIGELSLLVFEEFRNQGHGKQTVEMFFDNAFNYLGLNNIYLECYTCNPIGINFWHKVIGKYKAYKTLLPNRKYYKGEYHDSLYGSISKDNFNDCVL